VATAVAARAAPARRLGHLDFAVMSVYWVAIGFLWNSMGLLVVPYLVEHLVGRQLEGTATAFMENLGTVVAIVWQPLAGAISDRTRTPWGRRRPFIFLGTVGDAVFLTAIALSGAYLPLVAAYVLLQLASNTAQGPYQGLLPDLVPAEQKGTASGYYGASNLIGTLLGAGLSGIILAHAGVGAVLASVAGALLATMLLTVTLVPDRGAAAALSHGMSTMTAETRQRRMKEDRAGSDLRHPLEAAGCGLCWRAATGWCLLAPCRAHSRGIRRGTH